MRSSQQENIVEYACIFLTHARMRTRNLLHSRTLGISVINQTDTFSNCCPNFVAFHLSLILNRLNQAPLVLCRQRQVASIVTVNCHRRYLVDRRMTPILLGNLQY